LSSIEPAAVFMADVLPVNRPSITLIDSNRTAFL